MRHKFLFMIAVLMSTTAFAQFSGSGSGTKSDPYLISNAMQLDQMRNFLSNSNVYFKMTSDIDLEEYIADNYPVQGWLPIGTSSSPFRGKFDGNGKSISNLFINRPSSDYVGFFASISRTANISNLSISGTIIGNTYVGGLVGEVSSSFSGTCTIENVNIKGTIRGNDNIGGLIGHIKESSTTISSSSLSIKKCFADVSIVGNNYIGGLVGYSNGMTLTESSTVVSLSANNYCGGIVGYASYFFYNSSIHTSSVSTSNTFGNIVAQNYSGGIAGYIKGYGSYVSSVQNSYFHGRVVGKQNVGGIVGFSEVGTISKNYSAASISGENYVGGIIGLNFTSSNLEKNVAINNAVCGLDSNVGRIYGDNCGSVGAIGTVGTNKSRTTTIVIVDGIEQICEDNLQHGQSVGNSVLKYKATYQGLIWDFTNTWDIQETESYPYFKWQAAPPAINNVMATETNVSGTALNEAIIHVIINGQNYQTACNSNVWRITTSPLVVGDTIYAYATMEDKSASYVVSIIVAQAPITSLHLSDDASTFETGFYEGGIDYTRSIGTTDEYASFCFPFNVKQNENVSSIEELYIPLGIALKYADANNEDILKVLFVATDEVEAGTPFIAKLANAHSTNLSIVSATNEITQGVEAASANIIPYIYDASAVGSNAAVPTNGNISWCGTFEDLSNQTFYALQADGGFIYQLNANTNPFRGYLSVTNMPTIKKVIAFVDAQGDATSIEHMFGQDSYAPQKNLRNGQIVILRGNKTYTITGAEVK